MIVGNSNSLISSNLSTRLLSTCQLVHYQLVNLFTINLSTCLLSTCQLVYHQLVYFTHNPLALKILSLASLISWNFFSAAFRMSSPKVATRSG